MSENLRSPNQAAELSCSASSDLQPSVPNGGDSGQSPAPVVAEVRRAQESEPKVLTLVEQLRGHAASLKSKWEQKVGTYREVQIAALLEKAADEVARLTAERDEARERGGQLNCQLDVLRVEYDSLRTRLRGLEQQYLALAIAAGQCSVEGDETEAHRIAAAEAQSYERFRQELARLLTTPEEP